MIVIKLQDGQTFAVSGATTVSLLNGTVIEFYEDGNGKLLKLTKKEKWDALVKWVPVAWVQAEKNEGKLLKLARQAGFYAQGGGDSQMLWQVLKHLKLQGAA